MSSALVVMSLPSTWVMMSPTCNPAFSAQEPLVTLLTYAPTFMLEYCWAVTEETVETEIPR